SVQADCGVAADWPAPGSSVSPRPPFQFSCGIVAARGLMFLMSPLPGSQAFPIAKLRVTEHNWFKVG
ncbi:MAG: hypothetical protein ACLPKW_13585, partial [Acetobacteraceae bacterium]